MATAQHYSSCLQDSSVSLHNWQLQQCAGSVQPCLQVHTVRQKTGFLMLPLTVPQATPPAARAPFRPHATWQHSMLYAIYSTCSVICSYFVLDTVNTKARSNIPICDDTSCCWNGASIAVAAAVALLKEMQLTAVQSLPCTFAVAGATYHFSTPQAHFARIGWLRLSYQLGDSLMCVHPDWVWLVMTAESRPGCTGTLVT